MRSFLSIIAAKKRGALPAAAAPSKAKKKPAPKATKRATTRAKSAPKKRDAEQQQKKKITVDARRAMERRSSSTPREERAAMAKPKKNKKKPASTTSARKKPRTQAQKDATARMLAANRASKGGGGGSRAMTRAKPSSPAKRPSVAAASTKTRDGREIAIAYAMENNVTWAEGLLGGFVGIVWFFVTDAVLSLTQTHALTPPQTAPTDKTTPVYTDKPDKGQQYNWIATDAPLGIVGWGVGLLVMTGGPIALARFAFQPGLGRSVMQFMAFGGVLGVGVKGGKPFVGWLFRKTGWGQRIYASTINAQQDAYAVNQASKKDPNFTQPPMAAIPLAAGQWLTPPQAGVAGAPQNANADAERRAQGLGDAQQQQQPRKAAPPPPPPDDDDAPPQQQPQRQAPARQQQHDDESRPRARVVPMFSSGLTEKWDRTREAS